VSHRLLSSLVVCALSASAAAQLPADAAKKVDAVFAEWSTTGTPGCSIGVIRDQHLIFERSYGMADIERHVANTPRTIFSLQSTSKQFVAMVIVQLIQQGKLRFDDDVRKYIPELPDYGTPITIRHLLDHTSGLRDIGILTQDQGWRREEPLGRDQIMRLITRQKSLNHPPGADASYTNTGYFLLPIVAERITQEPMQALMKKWIFDPLGMANTFYREDSDMLIPDRAVGYRRDETGVWRLAGNSKNMVFTNISDLARWIGNFDHPVVGGAEAIRWMTTWGTLNGGQTTDWGLGLSPLHYRGLDGIYFSGGGWDGTSVLARFPDQKFAIEVLCNGSLTFNAETLAQKAIDVLLADAITAAEAKPHTPLPDPPPSTVTSVELKRYAGLYFTTHGGPWTREFRERDGKLRLIASPQKSYDLIPLGGGRFHVPDSTTEYTFTQNSMQRTSAQEPMMEFERVDETKPASIDEFAGTYWNDEIEAAIVFTVRDGKLRYAMPRQEKPDLLEPAFRDAFADGALMFRFLRDEHGRITGLTKHWDRVWNLAYTRQ
jgi:CubicO group peptidase (beta-lactamase class C family)